MCRNRTVKSTLGVYIRVPKYLTGKKPSTVDALAK